jgi:predicted O-methyltransferase YrrM
MIRQARLFTADADRAVAAISSSRSEPLPAQDPRQFSASFDINPSTKELLRGLVLEFMPRRLVETGVANGVSTRVILSAMEEAKRLRGAAATEESEFHSLDVLSSVATSDLKAHQNWRFHLVDEQHSFTQIMGEIGEIDFFFHDSNHGYWNQLVEYRVAWEHLAPGGLLVSDDINWSQAFLHFCEEKILSPVVLGDGAKFVGVVRKSLTGAGNDEQGSRRKK